MSLSSRSRGPSACCFSYLVPHSLGRNPFAFRSHPFHPWRIQTYMALCENRIPWLVITFPLIFFGGQLGGNHFQTHPNDPLNKRPISTDSTAHLAQRWCKPQPAARTRSIVLAGLYQVVQTRALREMIRSLQAGHWVNPTCLLGLPDSGTSLICRQLRATFYIGISYMAPERSSSV